ncbi:MAG: hypothetical protein GTO76_09480 [Planctomycetales bacterium]|nr:hypothetical protein [Planctomycetales bacterium]NIN08866.1 hypothetical protein [Planctomycetales bacterium]NIN77981.1 hypothetical protein [Planctomycetales bacterium]NIO35164.1 hypothetical protein [Planctomycetales bacterium]NIO46922.1 hypothetical protein [Planctomycetales bacterium]
MAKVSLLTAALCLFACQAFADQGISSATLEEMGLAGMEILSDTEALAVRGKGWTPDLEIPHRDGGKKPWVAVGGMSLAYLDHEEGRAGSMNYYMAEGKYKASGENHSYSTKVVEKIKSTGYGDHVETRRYFKSKTITAGGFSAAKAF